VLGIAIVYESDSSEERERSSEPTRSVSSPLQGDDPERHPVPDQANLTEGFHNSSCDASDALSPVPKNHILDLFKDFASISNRIILWIVSLAPWCIAFLIAGSISQAGEIDTVVRGVGVYVLATVTGILIHTLISLPILYEWRESLSLDVFLSSSYPRRLFNIFKCESTLVPLSLISLTPSLSLSLS
jgi:hypothetical protein